MKIYKCNNCGWYLSEEELVSEKICMEAFHGVSSDFPDKHYKTYSVCPYCGESSFTELFYEEEEIPDLLNELHDLEMMTSKGGVINNGQIY